MSLFPSSSPDRAAARVGVAAIQPPESRGGRAAAGRTLAALAGPPRWPVFGNLLQLDADRVHATLERWAVAYGPLYRIDLGRGPVLVVARDDLVASMLRARPDTWRRLSAQQDIIREMGGHGLFSAEGDDWRRQRRLVMSAFDPGHLARYFPSLVRVTERLSARLDAAARAGTPIDLQALLMRYTVDVTAGLAFGVDVDTLGRPDDALQADLDKVFPMLMRRAMAPFPWWRWLRLPEDRRFEHHLAKVHAAITDFVAGARARIANEPARREHPENLLEAMLVARDDAGGGLSEEEIAGNVLTVLLAGEDTTANTLCWALHLLSRHRPEWDAVVREVDAVLGDDPAPRDLDAARGLDTIERAVMEAMRLKPVAPFMLMQNNVSLSVGDVALPADSTVVCLMRPSAVPHDQPDAHAFRPGRSLDASSAAAPRGFAKASMPFGAGPRLCPGRYLAMIEMKMVIATIARNYELVRVETDDGSEPRERLTFTMAPVGLKMTLAPRATRRVCAEAARGAG